MAVIARMAGTPEDLDTLDAYCETGSPRRAADLLHPHHSSVSRRVEQLRRTLGVNLTELFRGHADESEAISASHLGSECGRAADRRPRVRVERLGGCG
ncbi:LysR family transcriptional regulator [Streptosporangium sp. NPDC023615]|uniref:helix-turn-helix domain-containing protein n=1 Tax=Streptosporangium sp. NPDC023615 TaxID=3154794 RepID=UPI00342DE8C7